MENVPEFNPTLTYITNCSKNLADPSYARLEAYAYVTYAIFYCWCIHVHEKLYHENKIIMWYSSIQHFTPNTSHIVYISRLKRRTLNLQF